jgi:hypothetical protein
MRPTSSAPSREPRDDGAPDRARFHDAQHVVGRPLNGGHDAVAVHFAATQDFENQHVEGARQQLAGFLRSHKRFRIIAAARRPVKEAIAALALHANSWREPDFRWRSKRRACSPISSAAIQSRGPRRNRFGRSCWHKSNRRYFTMRACASFGTERSGGGAYLAIAQILMGIGSEADVVVHARRDPGARTSGSPSPMVSI